MLSRLALMAAIMAWATPVIAETPYTCRRAEGVRQVGLRIMANGCGGPRADADSCYDAAALFIRVNTQLLQCPNIDRAGLRADLARARKLMSDMRAGSPGVAMRSEKRRIDYNRPRGFSAEESEYMACEARVRAACMQPSILGAQQCVSNSLWQCNR